MSYRRYAIAVTEVPPVRSPVAAPSLYESYKEALNVGAAQRGSVIPSRLWRAGVLGDLQVFRGAPTPSMKVKASAVLLWDWSGSQSSYRDVLIAGLTAITKALVQLRIRVWAGAYSGETSLSLEAGVPFSKHSGGQGINGAHIGCVKQWGDSFDARRIATLQDMPQGGTPTGAALHYVRQRVLPYSGDGRKTLLVVATDGAADSESHQEAEVKRLSAIRDLTLVTIYCGPSDYVFQRMRPQFPHCFWAPDRHRIPDAFSHCLRALRGGL